MGHELLQHKQKATDQGGSRETHRESDGKIVFVTGAK